MLFPWYTKYPYQNNEILNLDWILRTIDNLVREVSDFVSLNTIKYADPIQWNITTQYEKNTVVIDPITGSAYISTKPVPAGVGLNNTDYWNIIFTLDVISANKNITLRDDANNILATFESEVDDWLLWQGTLYIVTRAINIGQSYVVGYNIERYTVERFLKEYITNLKTYVDTTIGDLSELETEDKDSIVEAINSLFTLIGTTIGDLSELETEDKDSIVEAINELVTVMGTTIGSLDDLSTTDKDNIVDAINEVKLDASEALDKIPHIVDVTLYGVVGDGITDNTSALQDLIDEDYNLYFPAGTYLTGALTFTGHNTSIYGDGDLSVIKPTASSINLITIADNYTHRNVFKAVKFDCTSKTGVTIFKLSAIRNTYISDITIVNVPKFLDVTGSRSLVVKNIFQIGDCANKFSYSGIDYNFNTVVDNWLVYTNDSPTPTDPWFDLTGMVCTQWSNIVTQGRMECDGFYIHGMNEGTFFNNVVLVCPLVGFNINKTTAENTYPSCVQLNNVSIDQYYTAAMIIRGEWIMVNNSAAVNGNQRNATDPAIIVGNEASKVYFNNVISYNNSYAAFNIGTAANVKMCNVVAYNSDAGFVYTCPSQKRNNPEIVNCYFESVNAGVFTIRNGKLDDNVVHSGLIVKNLPLTNEPIDTFTISEDALADTKKVILTTGLESTGDPTIKVSVNGTNVATITVPTAGKCLYQLELNKTSTGYLVRTQTIGLTSDVLTLTNVSQSTDLTIALTVSGSSGALYVSGYNIDLD